MSNLLRCIFFGSQLSKKKKKGTRFVKKDLLTKKNGQRFNQFFFKIPLTTGAVKVSFILFRKIVNSDPSLALEWRMRDLVMFN